MRTDKILTIAYIGNGKSVNRYHLPFVLKRQDKIKVKTIYDKYLNNPLWERIENVNYTDNINDLYNDKEIDLIIVCTRSEDHYKYTKEVLEHGKNCLVEKPFTETLEQAKELFELAKSKGLIVQPYHNRRFDSDFLTTLKVIESEKLGKLTEIESNYDYYRPEVPKNAGMNIAKINSFLYSHGTHVVDQILSYFGKPDNIHYDIRELLGKGHMNDYYDIDMYYNDLKISLKNYNR